MHSHEQTILNTIINREYIALNRGNNMETYIKTVKGFDIHFEALPEHLSLDDTFDSSVTDIEGLANDIDNGKYEYFCAKVSAYKNGIELATDYLGACCYTSHQEFIDSDDYFADMTNTVIKEANQAINGLCN